MSTMGRRPSLEITQEILDKIESLSGEGLTQRQIAAYFGISHVTLHKMKNKDKRIDAVLKKGKSKTISFVCGELMKKIKRGNLTAIIFYLKTQARWSEKNSLTLNSHVKLKKSTYKIDTDDPIEASKIYQSIMTGSYNNGRNSTS